MKNPLADKGILDCWNHIGVSGDGSCRELLKVVHCKNCVVYTSAGRLLLDREPPAEYLKDWSERLSKSKNEKRIETVSVVIFRLSSVYFALDTKHFHEVTDPSTIHTIPHRSNQVLLGIVNVRGEIHVCVSIVELLGLQKIDASESKQNLSARLAVIENAGERWAFPVDQVCGIFRIDRTQFTQKSVEPSFTKMTFPWEENEVFYLDGDILFADLKAGIQ